MAMIVLVLLTFFSSLLQVIKGHNESFMFEIYSTNEINGNEIFTFYQISVSECVFKYDKTYGCLSVNFHQGNKTCVLTDYYPNDGTKTEVSKAGWIIYFRRTFAIDFVKRAEAWQSSTYIWNGVPLTADKAIDGDINGNANQNFCAHLVSSDSYWAMAFGTSGPVKEVKIYLRNDVIGDNHATYTITVCKSRDDVVNGKGTLCGSYNGPDSYTHPFILTITCANTIFGGFLRINKNSNNLCLCEVFVYPPK
ncbi:uncharacterized protein LOC132727639 [Ruditapes philippinarum]|uniref:uncharacterized protein LOC132727639 n=1 Tax=Ruditapes philippinarum TaxID=129788 RepID=UPI00295BBDC0|nr:uncharacterized protein LOC132727639 [Ruditapes philippinarum]